MHHLDWWQKEEEKRQDRRKANDLALINRELQNLLHKIETYVDREKYESESVEVAYGILSGCSIWAINYMNNMESPKVALAQGIFISYILKRENFEGKEHLQREVDNLMKRLGNVDWGLFLRYGELRGRFVR